MKAMGQVRERLSPLNFRGLLATMGLDGADANDKRRKTTHRAAIQCWKCPECFDVHDFEDEAEDCCAELEKKSAADDAACPVCAEAAKDHRDAADCCLWKDLDAPTRWAIADAVAAGGSWTEALGVAA